MGLSAASGAGISGADALARGTDVKDAMETGGALGLAGPVAGKLLGSVAGGVKNAVTPVSRTPQAADMVGNVPVPLDAGQAGGDIVAQRYLDQAQKGTLGPGAQKEVDAFRANQAAQLDAAKQGIATNIGGPATTPLDAAATAQQGVSDAAAAGKQAYQTSYDNFANTNGVIDAGAFQGLGQGIKTDLATAKQPKTVDDILTPASSKMVQHLDNVTQNFNIQNRATPSTIAPGGAPPTVTGVSLQGVDQVRKQLLDLASNAQPGSNDQRVARSIIGSFDQKIQDAVGSNLYSGDPNALGTLQQARRLYANYQQTFKSQGGGDMAGQVVEKMLGKQTGQAASHQDVANWMYGASKIGGSGQALAVADRLQNILQPDEWQQVRQGLFSKLVDTTEGMTPAGPQKISQRIADFINGSGKQLAEKMYTPQERALINQYGQVQARMVPKVGAVNHSGTSYSMASLGKWTLNALATVGGLHVGGPLGAAAGFMAHKGLDNIAENIAERTQTRAVLRHLYGQQAAPVFVGGMSPAQKAATLASRAGAYPWSYPGGGHS